MRQIPNLVLILLLKLVLCECTYDLEIISDDEKVRDKYNDIRETFSGDSTDDEISFDSLNLKNNETEKGNGSSIEGMFTDNDASGPHRESSQTLVSNRPNEKDSNAILASREQSIWKLMCDQIQQDFAPFLILIPAPVKKLFVYMGRKSIRALTRVFKGAAGQMLKVAGRLLKLTGKLLILAGENLAVLGDESLSNSEEALIKF